MFGHMNADELRAAAETRRELGRDYDEAVLASANLGNLGGTFATIIAWVCIAAINVVHTRSR
jgi:hypothetical protein